jgi:transcriptional regulator with XRE-family HTH domain
VTSSAERQAFGRRLRAEREKRRITLETIAAATKIKASTFARLEAGDASAMPAGVLRRGYVRQYAAAVGLPSEATAAEFVQLFEDQDSDAAQGGSSAQLRLTLAMDGKSEAAAGALAAAAAAAEAAALVVVAAVVALMKLGPFWPVLAATAIGYYATSNARLGRTPALWFLEAHSMLTPQRVRRPDPLDAAAPERAA